VSISIGLGPVRAEAGAGAATECPAGAVAAMSSGALEAAPAGAVAAMSSGALEAAPAGTASAWTIAEGCCDVSSIGAEVANEADEASLGRALCRALCFAASAAAVAVAKEAAEGNLGRTFCRAFCRWPSLMPACKVQLSITDLVVCTSNKACFV